MMQKLLILAGLLVIAATSGAQPEDASQAAIHVDVDAVRAGGAVQPVDGLTSAGQPDAAVLKAFADAGYVAVIDLRGPDEDRGMDNEADVVEDLGLDYVTLPVLGRSAITFEVAARLDETLAAYDGPVLVHCGSGNRVGALLALRKSMQGADDETAISYGKAAGLTSLEPVIRERLQEK